MDMRVGVGWGCINLRPFGKKCKISKSTMSVLWKIFREQTRRDTSWTIELYWHLVHTKCHLLWNETLSIVNTHEKIKKLHINRGQGKPQQLKILQWRASLHNILRESLYNNPINKADKWLLNSFYRWRNRLGERG